MSLALADCIQPLDYGGTVNMTLTISPVSTGQTSLAGLTQVNFCQVPKVFQVQCHLSRAHQNSGEMCNQ